MATDTTAQSSGFHEAQRHLAGLTARAEKRALLWLAPRTPRRVTSDHLTLLGLWPWPPAASSTRLAGRHPVAAAPRQRRPRPQLARRQPGRHPGPLPAASSGRGSASTSTTSWTPSAPSSCSGGLALLGPDEPARRRGPPRRLLPAGDRDLSRHLRDRPVQDLLGAVGGTELRIVLAVVNGLVFVQPRVSVGGSSWLVFDVLGVGATVALVRPRRRRRGPGDAGPGSRRGLGPAATGARSPADRLRACRPRMFDQLLDRGRGLLEGGRLRVGELDLPDLLDALLRRAGPGRRRRGP